MYFHCDNYSFIIYLFTNNKLFIIYLLFINDELFIYIWRQDNEPPAPEGMLSKVLSILTSGGEEAAPQLALEEPEPEEAVDKFKKVRFCQLISVSETFNLELKNTI